MYEFVCIQTIVLIVCVLGCEFLRAIPDCTLGYSIATHKAMYSVTHLLPENTVVGNNDIIPGLMDSESASKFFNIHYYY